MAKKRKPKVKPSFRLLAVLTDGVEGDLCPKKGGEPKRLGDGQCTGGKRKCRYFQGVGYFVTIMCSHPMAGRV